ncbi:MAG: hypothetical protein KDB27_21015 [Planctomycetales bacterium]|nr:hypothetical protein [Planctomycetales bacterium]
MRIGKRRCTLLQCEHLESRSMLAGDCFHIGCVDAIEVEVRESFISNVPFLLKAKLLDGDGSINRNVWDANASVQVNTPDAAVDATEFNLFNGLGSVFINTTSDVETLDLTISIGQHQKVLSLRNDSATVKTIASSNITEDTVWSNVVHVTSDLTIAENATLTIEPGTLVLVDGVETTVEQESVGSRIQVHGTLNSMGTHERPVTITAFDKSKPWGEIHVQGGTANLQHTIVSVAGNSPRGGHTNTGPAIRVTDEGSFSLADGAITDTYGKIMQADRGQVSFTGSLLTRSVMGPETARTGVSLEDTWIVDMSGRYRYDKVIDDNDGIYLHSATLPIELKNSVVAHVGDDGIDTAGAIATFQDMIVRDVDDKGFSISGGQVVIDHSLVAHVGIGVETKVDTSASPQTTINRTTIANANYGVRARGNSSEIQNLVLNSIIDPGADGDAVWVDGDENRTIIQYSVVGESWVYGNDNRLVPAEFVDAENADFRIRLTSPAIDAGNPDDGQDSDGSRLDVGFYSILRSEGRSLNAIDIDALCATVHGDNNSLEYDLNSDGSVDVADHAHLVEKVMGISYGDANVDGIFDSKDLVLIFQAGEYEDNVSSNSGWAEGDWNCDGEFDTSDLVVAFQNGRYVRA